jgi:hypothetical protein
MLTEVRRTRTRARVRARAGARARDAAAALTGRGRELVARVRPKHVLGAAITVWCGVQFVHVWQRHDRFGTFDNDLGFHTQYVWQLARGRSFSTILGLEAFGHNATFGYFLLVPLSWLGFGPHGLNLVLTLAVGAGAVPVYLLARDRLADPWLALALGVAWLLHPIVQGNVWETFHPDAMAMTPLLCAYLCASRGSWRWFAVWTAAALVWKADVALFVLVLGLLVAWRWNRRVGLATSAVGLVWFVLTVAVLIPQQSGGEGGGTVFGPLYGELGDTPTEVIETAVTDPGQVAGALVDHDPYRYARDVLTPYGLATLLSPATLGLALPQALINLLPDGVHFTRDPFDNPHYQALPMVAMALALVEGMGHVRRWGAAALRFTLGLTLAVALAASAAWGTLPFSVRADHFWPAPGDPLKGAKRHAIELVPDDAAVSAQYLLVAHLAERETVYSFPNPWRRVFYGVEGTPRPDPGVVRYVIQDEALLAGDDLALWQCLAASGSFAERYREGTIVLLQRVPGPPDQPVADLACQVPS